MEPTSWRLRIILLLFVTFHASMGTKFTLIVPKVLYYDSITAVSVSAVGVDPGQKSTVELQYTGVLNSDIILNATSLEFESDGSQVWSTMFTWSQLQQLNEKSINLVMSSGSVSETMVLAFAKNFGYIFIQTDKPIYTPRQTVKFRVIAVDEQQRLAKYKIRIDIKNHKQVIIDRKVMTAEEAFRAQELELPKETPPGNWSITASFEGVDPSSGSNQTVNFEVKEYVLPKFFTVYQIRPDVITKETEKIIINGTAKYFHKKAVVGKAYLQLGTWDPTNGTTIFQDHYINELTHGLFKQEIQIDKLFPMPQDFTNDKRLYVKLNITEEATSESDVYEDTSTSFSYSDYTVDLKGSKKYFKPGFPYTLQLQVFRKNGRLDPSTNVKIKSQFYNNWAEVLFEEHDTYKLDDLGKIQKNYTNIPEGTESISFWVTFADQIESEAYTHNVTKFASRSNEYIHILYVPNKRNRASTIHLSYTKPPNLGTAVSSNPNIITVLVMSKGHIVFTTSTERTQAGSSAVQLPSNLNAEISPRMRIIAYYMHMNLDYVIDSLVVDTKPVCLDEIRLYDTANIGPASSTHVGSSLYKPNDSYNLRVDGGGEMIVGLAAVDKAVLYLNNNQTFTRNLMFDKLGSHDTGSASGDGSSMEDILSNSGLKYMSLTVETRVHNRLVSHGRSPFRKPVFAHIRERQYERSEDMDSKSVKQEYGGVVPPQTTRNYFPESWLFREIQLPRDGIMNLNLTLPDSTTTWSFVAVGLSSNRGICMSPPWEQQVVKLFFADVRLPYKVKRLEEVTLKITIYNYYSYTLTVQAAITGSDGLCFLANTAYGTTENATSFTIDIKPNESFGKTLKVIPLRKGDLKILVDLKSPRERDTVEKTLHVVAEGQRVKKSITFVLDPEAKQAAIEPNRKGKITLLESSVTVNNVNDIKNKKQHTTIDLALPVEVIRGTELCHISAFGDLMGDIINHSVMESKKLIDTPLMDAEEVLGDLAPTVYALLYANLSGLMDDKLREKGRKFVRLGVTRLLQFMLDSNSFAVTPNGKPATWLTAFVLKTLCHASSLAFIDRENLIDKGFLWLWQMSKNGALSEQDWRLAKDSTEYRIMLSAEVLIAILECNKSDKDDHLNLQGEMSSFLEDNLEQIIEPMVLAKVTYALMLFDNGSDSSDEYKVALKRLQDMKRRNKQGHIYWSNMIETDESKQTPFWYRRGAQASAIEATAYALIIYVNHGDPDADSIANWLVGQRNPNGAFIGAMDSTVAIQALSKYSLQKHGVKVDLYCNVSSDRMNEYFHSFKFTEENATHPESLNNVPVGEVLEVLTKGQGLGQMQVNVEYNVPIDKNQKCTFDIRVKATKAEAKTINDMQSNPICASCKIGCPKKNPDDVIKVKINRAAVIRKCKRMGPPFPEGSPCIKLLKTKKKPGEKKEKPKKVEGRNRKPRSMQDNQVASKKLICLHVCLQHKKKGSANRTEVQIEMLTGYQPISSDIDQIREMPNVRLAVYDNVTEVLRVQFNEISCKKKTCVTFRASADSTVGRLMPAVVEVIQIGTAAPQCVIDYNPPSGEESLQIYCSDAQNSNKGECRCLSGLCGQCKPFTNGEYNSIYKVRELACRAKIVYKLQIDKVAVVDNWAEIDARVISLNRTGIDNITVGTSIKLTTPNFCTCPVQLYQNSTESVYLLTSDVEKFVDRKGNNMFRYLLNEGSTFLRVAEEGSEKSSIPSVPYFYLHFALSESRNCPT